MQDNEEDAPGAAHGGLLTAIRTILIADLVVFLDHVIAVAAAAKDNTVLLVTGLAICIPLVIFGSTLLLKVIERFQVLVWLGAALLGFIAGELLVEDPALTVGVGNFEATIHFSHHTFALVCGVTGAAPVVLAERLMTLHQQNRTEAA